MFKIDLAAAAIAVILNTELVGLLVLLYFGCRFAAKLLCWAGEANA